MGKIPPQLKGFQFKAGGKKATSAGAKGGSKSTTKKSGKK